MNTNQRLIFSALLISALSISQTVTLMAAQKVVGRPDTTLVDDGKSEKGFKSIFNGKDLTGWDGNPKLWSVKDGAIVGQSTPEKKVQPNTFLIWKDGEPANFELRGSFRLTAQNDAKPTPFANSGVQSRSKV